MAGGGEVIMSYDRRKNSDVLFFALKCAISDRQSLIVAYSNDSKAEAVIEARKDIKSFERMLIKIFGTSSSALEAEMAKAEKITLAEMKNFLSEVAK